VGALGLGYVGCGFMAQKVHIPNILGLDGCELLALAEVRSALGELVRARHGIPRLYGHHTELGSDPDVAAVVVSAHYAAQGEIAIDLLRAGKDVLMEKPMAVGVEQAERILDAERESGRRLMIAYMKRYDAGNETVKGLLDGFRASGELGEVRYVRNHGYCGDWTAGLDVPMERTDEPYPECETPWPSWLPEAHRKGYLGYLQQYTHNINLVRWFLDAGGDVAVDYADFDEDGMRGVAVLTVGGVRTVIESGWVSYHSWDEHTQIFLDNGWLKTCAPPLLLRNGSATVELYRGGEGEKSASEIFPARKWSWCYKEQVRHFVGCVASGEPFRSPASDAMEDVRALEAIYRRFVEGGGS
jgi:predicted dehydrogenase